MRAEFRMLVDQMPDGHADHRPEHQRGHGEQLARAENPGETVIYNGDGPQIGHRACDTRKQAHRGKGYKE